MQKRGQTIGFWKIFGGVVLSVIGISILSGDTNNIWETILGIIFIASGIAVLLRD